MNWLLEIIALREKFSHLVNCIPSLTRLGVTWISYLIVRPLENRHYLVGRLIFSIIPHAWLKWCRIERSVAVFSDRDMACRAKKPIAVNVPVLISRENAIVRRQNASIVQKIINLATVFCQVQIKAVARYRLRIDWHWCASSGLPSNASSLASWSICVILRSP